MDKVSLYTQIESLPEELKKEVEDFVQFLVTKNQENISKEKLKKERLRGLAKGKIIMKPDFDEPLEDFKEYM